MQSRLIRHPSRSRWLVAAGLALIGASASAADIPAPIRALEARGARIGEPIDAPGGLSGYTIEMRGRTMTAYVLPGGEHVIVGALIDAEGRNLSRSRIEAARGTAPGPDAWDRAADSDWIRDGAADAERVIYVFTDPNCPFCHRFWEATRPWVEAGRVQLRHVMVGVLKPDSGPKSATLLAAEDPPAALARHERDHAEGGVSPAADIPAEARRSVRRNNALMKELGFRATPTILYRGEDGNVRSKQGQPRGEALARVMGGPMPGS